VLGDRIVGNPYPYRVAVGVTAVLLLGTFVKIRSDNPDVLASE
jgi:hypothetical protein